MSAEQPWLLALLLLPGALLWLRWRGKRDATLVVGDLDSFARVPVTWRERLHRLPLMLRALALAALVIAVARPLSAKITERITSRGIDIIIALDLSDSMRAMDFDPYDRLTVAKAVTTDFIEGRIGDRIGLVLFGTRAITQCPLTVDHGVVTKLVQQSQPGMLGQATAIGMALSTAVNRLREAPGESRVIVLLTDGNNNTGKIDPITAARLAKALGVKIYTVGVGKRGESYVPIRGRMVPISDDLDEATLKQVAAEADGKYYRATDAQGLARIFAEIDEMEKTEVEREKSTHFQDKFEPALWAGVGLLLLELLLVGGPLRKVA